MGWIILHVVQLVECSTGVSRGTDWTVCISVGGGLEYGIKGYWLVNLIIQLVKC